MLLVDSSPLPGPGSAVGLDERGSVIVLPDVRNGQPDPSPVPDLSKAGAHRPVLAGYDNAGPRDEPREEELLRGSQSGTQSFIGFVRAELINYQKIKSGGGQRRTDDWLCGEILACEGVSQKASFSTETLRRFIAGTQKSSPALIQAVVDYLLHENWISKKDIAVHASEINVKAAVSLGQFFEVKASKAKEIGEDFSGKYVQYWLDKRRDNRLCESIIYLSYDRNSEITTAIEEFRRYDIHGRELANLFSLADHSAPVTSYPKISRLVPRMTTRDRKSVV